MNQSIGKRVLSLLLAIVMVLGLAPITAFAEELYQVTITVQNAQGQAVNGATVQLGGTSTTTNAAGLATYNVGDGTYNLSVSASGYAVYTDSVTVSGGNASKTAVLTEQASIQIENFVSANSLQYNGQAQELIQVNNSAIPAGVSLTYAVGSGSYSASIPTAKDIGTYTVHVKAVQGVTTFTKDFTVTIGNNGISATGLSRQYDGAEHDAIILTGTLFTDTIQYSTDNGASWQSDCPKLKDVDTISNLGVMVVRDSDEVYRATGLTATIIQNNQLQLRFVEGYSNNQVIECAAGDTVLDIKAEFSGSHPSDLSILYGCSAIKTVSRDNGTTDRGANVNNETGKITFNKSGVPTEAGLYEVYAQIVEPEGKTNYTDPAKRLTLFVVVFDKGTTEAPLVTFAEEELSYTLGSTPKTEESAANAGVLGLTASVANTNAAVIPDNGTITYEVKPDAPEADWVTIDSDTGKFTVSPDALQHIGELAAEDSLATFTVTAHKTASTYDYGTHNASKTGFAVTVGERKVYDEASATYALSLKLSDLTADDIASAYTIEEAPQNGWYQKATITANEGYKIAEENGTAYTDSISFTADGNEHSLFIQNTEKGIVSNLVGLIDANGEAIKIDGTKPNDFRITYSKVSVLSIIQEVLTLGFKPGGIRALITASDEASGIGEIKIWASSEADGTTVSYGGSTYTLSANKDDAVVIENADDEADIQVELVVTASGLQTQILQAVAIDRAGNEQDTFNQKTVYTNQSDIATSDDVTVVVDDQAPVIAIDTIVAKDADGNEVIDSAEAPLKVDYQNGEISVSRYNPSVSQITVTFSIKDTNLVQGDTVVSVTRKDGTSVLTQSDVTWADISGGKQGTFTISGDGEYTLNVTTSDMAANNTALTAGYVLDTTAPAVTITLNTQVNVDNGIGYTNQDAVYTIAVDEVNFSKDNVSVVCLRDGSEFAAGVLSGWTEQDGKQTATYTIAKENNGKFELSVIVNDGVSTLTCSETTVNADKPVVIDTVNPVVTVAYTPGDNGTYYNFTPDTQGVIRTAKVTVVDVNRAACPAEQVIANGIQVTDISGSTVGNAITFDSASWTSNGQFDLKFVKEGKYQLDILNGDVIKDLAGNTAVLQGSYEKVFTLDYTAPTVLLTYNIDVANKGTTSAGTWFERVIGGIQQLFGYWNDKIEVSVSVQDGVSGVASSSYTFTPFTGGAAQAKTLTLTQDTSDKKLFRGSIVLPKDVYNTETEQLNGWISVKVTDKCNNQNEVVEQGKHLIYDTISPKLSISYAPNALERSGYDNTCFYTESVTASIEVQETNFETDILSILNNGTAVPLTWNQSTNTAGIVCNTTSFGIGDTADGVYEISIQGKDYAGNALIGDEVTNSSYKSKKLVVDTKAPVLTVNGTSGTLCQTIDTTEYYMDSNGVHFTFSVEEHNFDVGLMTVTVTKNTQSAVAGTDYQIDWTTPNQDNPDIHECDIHFTKDGEYTVAIKGEDLSGNKLVGGTDTTVTDGAYSYGKNIVLDNTAPELSLVYEPVTGANVGQTKDGKQYISGKVKFTLTLKENFLKLGASESDLGGLYLHSKVVKDGIEAETDRAISLDNLGITAAECSQNRGTQTTYTYTWVEEVDAEYAYTAYYTDFVKRDVAEGHNYTVVSTPELIPVVDTTRPLLTIKYQDGLKKQYYKLDDLKTDANEHGYRIATVTIQERNLDTDVIKNEYLLGDQFLKATDVGGVSIKDNATVLGSITSETETDYIWVYTFAAEANYEFDLVIKDAQSGKTVIQDMAGNEVELTAECVEYEKVFTVDRTAPSAKKVTEEQTDPKTGPGTIDVTYNILDDSGNEKWYTSLWNKIRFGFWNVPVEITLTCYDDIAGIEDTAFTYTFTRAEDVKDGSNAVLVSKTNAETFTGNVKLAQDSESKNLYTAIVKLPTDVLKTTENPDGLEENAQLDGTFAITIHDRCGNESKYDGKPAADDADGEETRIIFDTISPTREIGFATVVDQNGNKTYFADDITATVNVTEANFFIKDGKTDIVETGYDTTWVSNDADNHVGTFKITGEGTHEVTVTGKDYAGNEMEAWQSEQLVIDMSIEAPTITVNGEAADGNAYKDEALIGISYIDENFKGASVTILRTRMGEKDVDVTELFDKTVDEDDSGGFITYEDIEAIPENDGIYVVTATMQDWAGHEASTTVTFSVNRFGSVYTYEDYLLSIIKNGGLYIKAVEQDLIIHEFNADRLVGDVKIQITRDGKPLSNVIYTSNALENMLSTGESGWFEYTHIISKDNFKEDGLYKISISSEDFAGNRPENTNMEGMSIQFYVDSTPPELTSVTGLEKAIVNAEIIDVHYTAYDTIGLKSVKVYLDSVLFTEETTFAEDRNNYSSSLVLNESSKSQSVRIVLEDLAGNILDTEAPEFESAYTMVKEITVSTNFWVRFYANKPLFYGCIAAVVVTLLGVGIGVPLVIALKKKGKYDKHR